MKQLLNTKGISKKYLAIAALFFSQSMLWAQDKTVDVNLNIDKGGDEWYAQPWMWVVGGAVFLIIIVALVRGKSSN
ncbi:hypothetical protein [Flavobacterium sp.]|uniref:hypothetical protein n=1 Tax=Flavobacterium sp. TaxID=239 RepID=UPI002B4B5CF1|nr:hypothetical protein [Flavobacterium sp.]HLF52232.1 hypothetical protein [Flavobacterium sp.]